MVTTRQAPGVPVPVQPGHVCILFPEVRQLRKDVTRDYVNALEARGVRHLLVGGRAFHDREEIRRSGRRSRPSNGPTTSCRSSPRLRGALFAIGDEELLEYRHAYGRALHPFRVPANLPAQLEPIGDTLTLLARCTRSATGVRWPRP
jgi:hypothetical protein